VKFIEYETEKILAKENGREMKPNIYVLLLTASLDLVGVTISSASLIFLPGSVYEMLFGLELISVAFFSKIFLKSIISKNQWLGLVSSFLGITIVGLSDIFYSGDEDKSIGD
jgi:drug/metabolite transporter (DMT)-like permease